MESGQSRSRKRREASEGRSEGVKVVVLEVLGNPCHPRCLGVLELPLHLDLNVFGRASRRVVIWTVFRRPVKVQPPVRTIMKDE